MPFQTFSAANIKLNTLILSGNAASPRLFYNGSGLLFIGEGGTPGGGTVATGFKIIGGSGLVNSGNITTMDGSQIVLNISAVSGLTVGDDTIGANYDDTSINLNGAGKLQVFQIAPSNITGLIQNSKLQNSSVTINPGSGLANGGTVALGGSITLDIFTRSGVMVSGTTLIARYDNTTIGIDANEKLTVIKVPNALTNGLGIDTLSFDGSSAKSVGVNSQSVVMTTGAQTIGGDKTFSNNVRVVGNLTVDGTTTTVNSEIVTIADNIILLNSNVTGVPTENAGIEIDRGTSTYADLIWNETSGTWQAGLSGAAYNIITENRIQVIRAYLTGTEVSRTVTYNPITTSLSGLYIAQATLSSTGVNPDLIGCMISGYPTSTQTTVYFTAPIPDAFYSLNVTVMGL
jgi:hypothetical protein